MQLFVYGTLKKGMRAHHLLDGAEYIGRAWVMGSLYNGGFPCYKQEGSAIVYGELYKADAPVIRRCDKYEGHPDLFKRTTVRYSFVPTDQPLGDGDAEVYVYQGSVEGRPLVAGGKWE